MLNRTLLKQEARTLLAGHRPPSMAVFVIYSALQAVLFSLTYGFGSLLLMPPLSLGMTVFYLAVWRRGKPDFTVLFSGFRQYIQALLLSIFRGLLIILWTLLLIVPGIIKALSYSQARYLIAEYPHLDSMEAITLSKKITKGHKGEILMFYLSFFGWYLLAPLTLGLVHILYTGPYMQIAGAGLYEELKREALASGALTPVDLQKPWN